ncbi:MAG: DUF58 domain-containing protein [Lachnospiraceae bacterium]|nr:DUF58 domain-containing protein [Lachnospiraceae bacterium]
MTEEKIFDENFYKKLNILRTKARMNRAAAGQSGARKSRAKGSSVEFSDFREYMLGDDIRRIDWNAYGRFDRLFVKLFNEEKEGVFRVYVDTSASMDFGEKSKAACALRIAGALSYCVLENADRLVLNAITPGGVVKYKSVTGRNAFARTLEKLENMRFDGKADTLEAIKRSEIKSAGMSIIISDFYTENLEDILRYLAYTKQEILLVQVLSREEAEPALEGTLSLIDSEDGSELRVTASGALMKTYRENYERFMSEMDRLSRKYGAKHLTVVSDEPLDEIFYKILTRIGM